MSNYREDDLGQFNDSTVFLQPVTFNPKAVPTLAKHYNPNLTNLGIYDSIKLTPYIENKTGELVQFITLDPQSLNTFVTNQAMNLLERYSTDQLCFVMIVGNREAGKSFFCDKLLNLAQIRGNHFCRKKNKGINIWSTPFCKEDLKIFILEISNCDISSQQFKILSTYALMIGSAFVTLQALGNKSKSPIEELDKVISDVAVKLSSSCAQEGDKVVNNSDVFLPKIYYNLQRSSGRTNIQGLKSIQFYANQILPDALEKTYSGPSTDLLHLPFQDTKCINQDYVRRIATIFSDLYSKLSQKRYKELTLNGNIIAKIIKQIQRYLNNRNILNVQDLYLKVINDLYQSAYNYCILNYHEEMQSQFEDQQPKSLEELLVIFERLSGDTLVKFQQFNLDQRVYEEYYEKLENHITQKQKMIMEINEKKTEQIIFQDYNSEEIGNIKYYRNFVDKIEREHKELTHGRAEIMAKVNSQFYMKSNNSNSVQFQTMKVIEALKDSILTSKKERDELAKVNQEKASQRSKANKEQEGYLSIEHQLKTKIHSLEREITRVSNSSLLDPAQQKQEEHVLTQKIASNTKVIEQLRGTPEKDQRITKMQKKIEEVIAKCTLQERLLKELNEAENKPTESVMKQSRKPRQSSKIIESK